MVETPPLLRKADQAAAICHQHTADGPMFLLIRTSDGERWGFPKGWIESGESLRITASREAFEEAGVSGQVSPEPVAFFRYLKWKSHELTVAAFLLRVESVQPPLEPHRHPTWFAFDAASDALSEGRGPEYAQEIQRALREAHITLET